MSNLARAKTVRRRMSWILSREGAMPRVSGLFLKYMIQAVMFFRAETWVATTRMGTVLAGFQTQVTRRLTGQLLCRATDRMWKIYLGGGGKWSGGFPDDGGIRQAVPEQGRTLYCYTITVRTVWGVGEGSLGASRDAMVGIGGNWPVRGAGGNSNGGGRGVGRGVTGR